MRPEAAPPIQNPNLPDRRLISLTLQGSSFSGTVEGDSISLIEDAMCRKFNYLLFAHGLTLALAGSSRIS